MRRRHGCDTVNMSDMTRASDEQQTIDALAESIETEDAAAEDSIRGMTATQRREAETFAIDFLKRVLRLRGVRIDREQFLKAELHKRGLGAINMALAETPASGGVDLLMLDDIALSAIRFETRKSSAFSFAAGLPGGFAMLGTVPADITQFYVHAFRVMQKLAYIYGWQSLLADAEDIDDETLGQLAVLLGVMMGVGAASGVVTSFAANVARPAVEKRIANVALTKTAWYLPMKQVLSIVGIKVTKQTFANTVAKAVPVVGGVVSGGMTLITLDSQSKRLMRHLREIPPPNVDAAEYLATVRKGDADGPDRTRSMGAAMGDAMSATVDRFRSVDLDGDGIPDEPRARTALKGAAFALKSSLPGRGRAMPKFEEEAAGPVE